MKIIGHKKQRMYLENVMDNDALHHAYLFSGPSETGKKTIALEISAKLLGVDHPNQSVNFRMIQPEIDKKTGQKKSSITISQIQDIQTLTSSGGIGSGKRIVIIDDAHTMTTAAQNALLKTLEEPSANTHFFLIVIDDSKLLPTIHSRAMNLHFGLVPHSEYPDDLKEVFTKQSDELRAIIHGRPGMVIDLQSGHDMMIENVQRIVDIRSARPHERMMAAEKMAKSSAVEIEHFLLDYLSIARSKGEDIEHVLTAMQLLKMNVNKTLVLEKAIL